MSVIICQFKWENKYLYEFIKAGFSAKLNSFMSCAISVLLSTSTHWFMAKIILQFVRNNKHSFARRCKLSFTNEDSIFMRKYQIIFGTGMKVDTMPKAGWCRIRFPVEARHFSNLHNILVVSGVHQAAV